MAQLAGVVYDPRVYGEAAAMTTPICLLPWLLQWSATACSRDNRSRHALTAHVIHNVPGPASRARVGDGLYQWHTEHRAIFRRDALRAVAGAQASRPPDWAASSCWERCVESARHLCLNRPYHFAGSRRASSASGGCDDGGAAPDDGR